MISERVGTIFTKPGEEWDEICRAAGLSREELLSLNPHLLGLDKIEAGIPVDIPNSARAMINKNELQSKNISKTPYDIARQELLLNISEDPRPGYDHPRIRMYHATTSGGAAPDEVAWCSSFVNFCVEQAGVVGTDSKAARSWLTWGNSVDSGKWLEGDIVIFKRGSSSWQGHVGFLVDWLGERPTVLGGNQNNRLSIATPYQYGDVIGVRRVA